MKPSVNAQKTKVDCGNRSNSLGGQMNDLQGLVHKVALVGEESGREVSSDPNTEEARNAEATGQSFSCRKNSGTLNLIEYNGRKVLIGAAHSFYDNENLLCDEGFGTFFPDDHYSPNRNSGITFNRGYKFKLPPLNHETAYKGSPIGISSTENLKDFVILEIEDENLLKRQLGGLRASMRMEDVPTARLNNLSNNQNLSLISSRRNFYDRKQVSIESGCKILNIANNNQLRQHTCDTGFGSSGSSLSYVDSMGQLKSLGIHYGSDGNRNFFVPSENIVRSLNKIFPKENTDSKPVLISI